MSIILFLGSLGCELFFVFFVLTAKEYNLFFILTCFGSWRH